MVNIQNLEVKNLNNTIHTFHIPVQGIGFSIDTPIKVAKYGISSALSLVNDNLVEKIREYYCKLRGEIYIPSSLFLEENNKNLRSIRITQYLDLLNKIVTEQVEELRNSLASLTPEVRKYFSMLPDYSEVKKKFLAFLQETSQHVKKDLLDFLKASIIAGELSVNIMTKIDRAPNPVQNAQNENYLSDALSALEGFAHSKGKNSIIFSAGVNRRLYSYLENFDCFFPDRTFTLQKTIILKVSDYRSALTQSKLLASKGIWVSEFRIESPLNCSGHAFPCNGKTIGIILEEFKQKRETLSDTLFSIYQRALWEKKGISISVPFSIKFTYQGGVGTEQEHQFILNYYGFDSVGWGAAFLFVPEVINISPGTLSKLIAAEEKDFYLSSASPLGVPYNTLKNNIDESTGYQRYLSGNYGHKCVLGYLANDTEFTPVPICRATREYMDHKIESIKQKNLPQKKFQEEVAKIVTTYCICADLSKSPASAYYVQKEDDGKEVYSVCAGKTAAYFHHSYTLEEMTDLIYGRSEETFPERPSLFLTELRLNIEYLENREEEEKKQITAENILSGIDYYLDHLENFRTALPLNLTENEFQKELEMMKQKITKLLSVK